MGSKIPLLLPCPLSNVHCHLVYANVVWSSAKDSALKPLYLKQKAAVRIISSSSYNSHTEPIFKSLKILPLPKLSEFFKLQFFQQFKQGLLPSALKNIYGPPTLIGSMVWEMTTTFVTLSQDWISLISSTVLYPPIMVSIQRRKHQDSAKQHHIQQPSKKILSQPTEWELQVFSAVVPPLSSKFKLDSKQIS